MNARSRGWAVAGVLVAALAVSACGGSGGGATSGNAERAAPQGPAAGAPAPAVDNASKDLSDQNVAIAPAQYQRADRSIVYTGDISVRVKDVDKAAADVIRLVEAAGGFVGGDKRTSGSSSAEAHLTLRVPAARFTSTVDALAALGREESRGFSADDVTQQVVDLDAQIASQQASVDRTRALLARAQTVGEIVSIEGELAKRESALGTLQARKRNLAELAALSTITAHLLGPNAPAPVTDDDSSFVAGLKTGWHGFLSAMTVILAVPGFLLPFAVVFAVPAAVVWFFWRRRRRPAAAAPAAAPVE